MQNNLSTDNNNNNNNTADTTAGTQQMEVSEQGTVTQHPTHPTTYTNQEESNPDFNNADNESSSDLDSTSSSDIDSSSDDESFDQSTKGNPLQRLIADTNYDDDDEDDPMSGNHPESIPSTRNEVTNPQVPALPINQLPEPTQLHPLGTVHSIVDCSVTIKAHISGDKHVLDSESLVVLGDKQVLGQIFDVFGPVSQPMYSIRFNSAQEAKEKVSVGVEVYFAQDWSKLVVTEKLRKDKGTDASNMYDEEVSEDNMEFSDDEMERMAKQKKKKKIQDGRRQNTAQMSGNSRVSRPTATPASNDNDVPGTVVGGRQLQSYGDLYDADLGF
ncbi:hypothetical protein LPJ57_001092 [Coemansia sp. RSA 486]|nr:hypothetical protein LPJ57_001092 [Coemansia sp. RSA 486]